jgi:pyrroloquinoline quinone biosynthesis protein B
VTLEIIVLGSAAGGGFPQWNCGCEQCRAVRAGATHVEARTEDGLAISAGNGWFLLNAPPALATRLARTESLWPSSARGSPIRGVVLTNGDLDHCLGLFSLREWHPLVVYATERVWEGLRRNAILDTLRRFPGQLVFRRLRLDEPVELHDAQNRTTGLCVLPFAAPGKPPLHLMGTFEPRPDDNIGLEVVSVGGRRLVYLGSAASFDAVMRRLEAADLVLLDGTFWTEQEPLEFGAPHGARAMGHVPISGPEGSLRALSSLNQPLRFFTHVNHTNPILHASSEARRTIRGAGWDVARDGQRFLL